MSSKPFMQLIASLETDVKRFVQDNLTPVEDSVFFLEERGEEIFKTVFTKEEKIEALAITASLLYQEILAAQKRQKGQLTFWAKCKVLILGE